MDKAKVYIVPNLLGDGEVSRVCPAYNTEIVSELWDFVVENEKAARKFIKKICPQKKQSELRINILNKKTPDTDIPALLQPLQVGKSIGIISDAGMPGIADPGARLVAAAHTAGYEVVPLVGASSIFLALASSGFNGQKFSFHGYLPIDKWERKKSILHLEQLSRQNQSAEIFMETPYRNQQILSDLFKFLHPNTRLCVACDISLPTQFIFSGTKRDWKKIKENFHKRPAIFIVQA